jgi:hypothetical protein
MNPPPPIPEPSLLQAIDRALYNTSLAHLKARHHRNAGAIQIMLCAARSALDAAEAAAINAAPPVDKP